MYSPAPTLSQPENYLATLEKDGFVSIGSAALHRLSEVASSDFQALAPLWQELEQDQHLRDGGRYRYRRHASFHITPLGQCTAAAHRAHWQSLDYNALHGGLERWFAPIHAPYVHSPVWPGLLRWLSHCASALRGPRDWYAEVHPFRIVTGLGEIGRPTPEGAHRDGVDLVAVILIHRENIKGGETRVFAADGAAGLRFTLEEPWSVLLLDDARMIHESTPIQPQKNLAPAWRDTLVITLRGNGFQSAETV